MASKEKIKKKKKTQPSPSVNRKAKSTVKETLEADEEGTIDDIQGSQVSVRSANEDNIKDNTDRDPEVTFEIDNEIPTPQQSSTEPQTSVSETKKKKKDLVEQKLGKGKGKKDTKKRAPSPEQTIDKPMGSAVSLRSNVSRASREAWVERKEDDVQDKKSTGTKVVSFQNATSKGTQEGPNKGPGVTKGPFRVMKDNKVGPAVDSSGNEKPSSKSGSVVSVKDATVAKTKREDGLKGVTVEVVEDCPEKHAYIPYLYARNCIAKITEDMKAMKQTHIIIVENIQEHYGVIESETQEQFNMFVLCMREEYSSKRHAFRQVIDTHKVELDKKERYWNEMLTSLAERNNRLLKEKRMLLVHNKTEIERIEKEKEEVEKQYSEMGTPTPVPGVVPVAWEEERKVLQDQLQSEKIAVASLKQQLANQNPEIQTVESGAPIKAEVVKVGSSETAAGAGGYGASTLATASVVMASKENNKQMEKERKNIEEENNRMTEERTQFETEREMFAEERKKWMDKIESLETDMAEKNVSGNEWKVKHDVLHGRLEETAGIQAKYLTLESQYAALALLVKDTDTSGAIKGQLEKTQAEKSMMNDEKAKLDKDITKWEKEFEKENKRKPTDDDKPDSVKEMYTTREEVSYMVTTLETKESTFKQVENGTVPDVPEIPHTPVDTRDPEVITVEVKVPDPTVVKELEKSQSEVITVKTEITTLHQDMSDLLTEIRQQNEQLGLQRTAIAELEHEVAKLKAEGVATGVGIAGGSNISDEEMEALKKENRELRRDMKKMIKQYERLAAMKQPTGDDSGAGTGEDMSDMGRLDNKIADLEAENEALKEERTILKERVRTITETITVTHFEENKKTVEEKDKKIDDLLNDLTKLRTENVAMAKDMKKMVKSHVKTKARLDELVSAEKAVKLLEIVAMRIHEIHHIVPEAADQVNDRLDDSVQEVGQSKELLERKQAAYQQWLDNYQKIHGKAAGKGDRDAEGEKLHEDWEDAKGHFKNKHLQMSALLLMKTGDVFEAVGKDESADKNRADIEIASLEKALTSADNRLIDLEATNKNMEADRDRHRDKVEDLEKMLVDMQKQLELNTALMADSQSTAELSEQISELQKKSDGFESELMQERMSHVNTRDELETLRKQLDTVKEEMENEKQGVEARLDTVKVGFEAQIGVKDEELSAMRAKNDQLEKEKLSKLPPDTAAEIKTLQDKLKQLESDQSGTKTSSVALTAQIAELTSQLDTTSKNLETTRAANRELEAKVKAGRSEKANETKKLSRHLEEKQQKAVSEDKQRISMLVKRVKELEAHAGKTHAAPVGAAVGGGKTSDAEVMKLKREIKDQESQIKRLEKEVRLVGGGAVSAKDAVAEKNKSAKHEKILKDLEKKLDHEKDKFNQLMEGLKAADEENKGLRKELDDKSRVNAKLGAELKTISVAAKEGIEAAHRVKELESDNKKLSEENVILTKNFESERVLRKKYYNMVEDMKGKIRVYCRARPMSKTELNRGNKAVCVSSDEYSISVDTPRGLKEFQYDQVFMENSTQEKIFEDTNNLIQSAMDGYNVCIFAYGQTGSGKTFTMIGDKDQNYPGISPRAFNRIFQMADEMKNKFTVTVEVYMMELYNDKLIDLFAKPGGGADDEKLDIKKDKKGMVYVQGSIVKPARNAKELFALFEEGSTNRHVASTKMNDESSRSHLIVGIIMESTNKNTGNVTKGKLSLVDLAGSERVAKTQAGAEQLKEAMSINKSLSALGDVISALSSDQQFIPYRNNKLTMLMQDSLGGNAKTLMFVNISPADYNMDETVISLTYASRVKLITNDASKNADNKEIARLKNVIAKLKSGEAIEEEDM